MLTSVQGVYRDGKIELLETPANLKEARVIVTFLPADGPIDLRARGISEEEAAEMRWGFGAGAADWDDPVMNVYNDL
jgi:hypothetical protein